MTEQKILRKCNVDLIIKNRFENLFAGQWNSVSFMCPLSRAFALWIWDFVHFHSECAMCIPRWILYNWIQTSVCANMTITHIIGISAKNVRSVVLCMLQCIWCMFFKKVSEWLCQLQCTLKEREKFHYYDIVKANASLEAHIACIFIEFTVNLMGRVNSLTAAPACVFC